MNKKHLIQIGAIPVLALLLNLPCVAQVVFSEWLTGTGTRGWDIVNDMCGDESGNIYITGSFTDTVVKTRVASEATITTRMMYVAKFDTNGQIIWNKNICSGGAGFGSLIGRGINNEMIIAGGHEISNKKAGMPSGRSGFFISALSTKGTVNWTQNFTGSKLDYLTSLIVDTLGAEIMITGYFNDTLRIGEKTLVTGGMSDGAFLRFDLNGNIKSTQVIGGKGEDKLNGIAIDSLGNRYVAGTFQRKIQFDKKTVLDLKDHQERGLFLARYSYEGDKKAAKQLATGKQIRVHSIINIDNHIMIAGSFSNHMVIGDQILSSRGSDDIFLLCLDPELKIKWYKQIGGAKKDRASKMINIGNEIILSGSYSGSINIDEKSLKATGTGSDVFIVALDYSGNLRWMRSTGGESDDYPTCMIPGSKDYLYIAGSFREKFNMNGKTLQSAGEEDAFIGRLENCHSMAPVFKKPEDFCEGNLLQLDAGAGFVSYNWANGQGHERTFDIDLEGSYPLELVAANGCIIYDTVAVIDIPQPLVNLGNDTTIADTSRFMLHVGKNFAGYLWNNGTTTSECLIKGVELKEGPNRVKVTVTNDKGCVGNDEIVITMIRTMANHVSALISESCVVFPNPTSDLVTVYFTMPFKSLELTIYDQMGKELIAQSSSGYVENTPLEFNFGILPKGLYTVYIKTERGVATKKIALQ
ncbi:MAG: T9SS type A sorting domain-containing protein [Bacteroidales bacterium]|nr:T9SS type A sorting domain-containing protein [Bacteroidales bacterium]